MLKASDRFLNGGWKPLRACVRRRPYPVSFHHFLRNMPTPQYTKLENGLTVVTEEREDYHASVGIFVDAGSRYEVSFENGIMHFFEHIAFKGTNARKRPLLEEQMMSTGALFDCVTTRELACYRVHTLSQHLPLCVDLLTDCIFNNSYSEPDIERQKKVVYLEMKDHDRDPDCLLDDYLHATAFQGTPLANTVMGPSNNLYNFNAMSISRYMNKYFDSNRTVLAAVGGVKHDQMVCLANTYMSKMDTTKCIENDLYRFTGSEIRARDDSLPLCSVAVAVEGPALCDEDHVVMQLAAEIVGGWERSQGSGDDHAFPVARASALAGFCDVYRSFYITYKDTGLWGVKFTTAPMKLEDMLVMVQHEWMCMCSTISEAEVERAKRTLKCKLLSKDLDTGAACASAGRWTLMHGYRAPLHARIAAVEEVYAKDVREACMRYIYDKCPAVVAVGPSEELPDYTRIRAGMYWLRL